MEIKGINVKGIKQAVGDYKRRCEEIPVTIIYDYVTNTVECVDLDWYMEHRNERYGNYMRYTNIIDLIVDAYKVFCAQGISRSRVVAVLHDYVI